MSCVLDMIFQWGGTLKASIKLPATSRHRHHDLKIVESDVKPWIKQTNNMNGKDSDQIVDMLKLAYSFVPSPKYMYI